MNSKFEHCVCCVCHIKFCPYLEKYINCDKCNLYICFDCTKYKEHKCQGTKNTDINVQTKCKSCNGYMFYHEAYIICNQCNESFCKKCASNIGQHNCTEINDLFRTLGKIIDYINSKSGSNIKISYS